MQYWIAVNNQKKGPMTLSELKAMNPVPTDLVWREGLQNWVQAATLPELSDIFPAAQQDVVPEIAIPEQHTEQPVATETSSTQHDSPAEANQPAVDCATAQPEAAPSEAPQCNEQRDNNDSWREGYAAGFAAAHQQRQNNNPVQPTGAPMEDCPPTYLALSITMLVVMFFCCCCSNPISLIGIVAIIYSNKVRPAYELGNIEEARRYSNYALYWNIANVLLSIVGLILTLVWSVLTGFATSINCYI